MGESITSGGNLPICPICLGEGCALCDPYTWRSGEFNATYGAGGDK